MSFASFARGDSKTASRSEQDRLSDVIDDDDEERQKDILEGSVAATAIEEAIDTSQKKVDADDKPKAVGIGGASRRAASKHPAGASSNSKKEKGITTAGKEGLDEASLPEDEFEAALQAVLVPCVSSATYADDFEDYEDDGFEEDAEDEVEAVSLKEEEWC